MLLLAVSASKASAIPIQQQSYNIPLTQNIGTSCPMISALGTTTETYSSLNAENGSFVFTDDVPSTAVIYSVSVTVSMLGRCPNPDGVNIYLNRGAPNVDPVFEQVGSIPAYPANYMTSCGTPAQFVQTTSWTGSGQLVAADPMPYFRNSTNVISIVDAPTGTCSDPLIESVTVNVWYYDNIPSVTFDLSAASPPGDHKVLMHRWRSEAGLATARSVRR